MKEHLEQVCMTVNGIPRKFIIGDGVGCVSPSETLLDTIRDRLGLTAAKPGLHCHVDQPQRCYRVV